MYQRIGPVAFKKDLGNILELCKHLNNPQNKFKSIHIAGTNGKGSVTHILAALAIHSGYKTGYYTSPHLIDFRERIRIDGQMIPQKDVVKFVADNREIIERLKPSFFEITVAMAFDHFAQQKVDIAIIETGLGGRLDSTNIIYPLLSVITNIGHDHMDMLGDTLELIAGEKAGIIKQRVPVVIGETQEEVEDVFLNKAKEMQAPIFFADEALTTEWIETDLGGSYQQKNLRTALKAMEVLAEKSDILFNDWRTAVKQVLNLTGFAGRWQKLEEKPLLIVDTGHNEEGIAQVVQNLKSEQYKQLHMVFGMVSGKDFKSVLKHFPSDAKYYLIKPNVPRGLETTLVKEACDELGYESTEYKSIAEAFKSAKHNCSTDDCIFVGGSTFTVADFLAWYSD